MEITAELNKHKYAFVVPCYEGKIQTETTLSLLDTCGKLMSQNVPHCFIVVRGGALIADVRNELAHRFLQTDADTMICIDADIAWEWEAMLRLMVYSNHYPLVAGCYPCRTDPVKFIVNQTKDELNEHGLLEANGIGMGFVAIQRRVLEEMKVPTYIHKDYPTEIKQFFATGIDEKRHPVGEDVWFFREAYKQGFPVMVDPAINLQHHGPKCFDYKFQDYVHQILKNEGQPLGENDGV